MLETIKKILTPKQPTVAQVEAEIAQLTRDHAAAVVAYDADATDAAGARVTSLENALSLARHRLTSAQARASKANAEAATAQRARDLKALNAMVADAQHLQAGKHGEAIGRCAVAVLHAVNAARDELADFNARVDAAAAEAKRIGVVVVLPPKQSESQLRVAMRHAVFDALRAVDPMAALGFPYDRPESPLEWLEPIERPRTGSNPVITTKGGAQ